MQNTTPFFPGFHLSTLRKKPQSARQKLLSKLAQIKQKSLSELGDCFKAFIPGSYLLPAQEGAHSRRRLFSKENTFWAFLSQVLDADGGCQEVVRKVQAVAALKALPQPSSSTAAYCKARQKLPQSDLEEILGHTALSYQPATRSDCLAGRRVVVVDGTGLSMPDTPANQAAWPQKNLQKPGCGFPLVKLCACFCLRTGSLLSYRLATKNSHDLPLLREQIETFEAGDILLGDKGFCSYFDMVLFQSQQVDSVITLARRTPGTAITAEKVLGENDLLIKWAKPAFNKRLSYSREQWEQLPKDLLLRQIKVSVTQPGFRVKEFYIVTTLLDPLAYPAHEIAELYLQRWEVELFFRDIKTTMGMDILRCKTPALIVKEIVMYFIAYNCIRRLMVEAAKRQGADVSRVSFKGSVQALRQWESHLHQTTLNREKQSQMLEALYASIVDKTILERPGRREPRCRKRRPKTYQLLTRPRHQMVEIQHRSSYRAGGA